MPTHYRCTFVCRDYPGIFLSNNSVMDLLQRIGQDGGKRFTLILTLSTYETVWQLAIISK